MAENNERKLRVFTEPGQGWQLIFFLLAQLLMGWLLYLRLPDNGAVCWQMLLPFTICAALALSFFPRLHQDTAIPILILLLLTVCYAVQLLWADSPASVGNNLMANTLVALVAGVVCYLLASWGWSKLVSRQALIAYALLSAAIFAVLFLGNRFPGSFLGGLVGPANSLLGLQPLSAVRFAALLTFAALLQRGPRPRSSKVFLAIAAFCFYALGMAACDEFGFLLLLLIVFVVLLLYTYPGVGLVFSGAGLAVGGVAALLGYIFQPSAWVKIANRFLAVKYRHPTIQILEQYSDELYQYELAKDGIARGGLFGVIEHGSIPVAESDMVLAALVESLGLITAVLVLLISLALVLRIFRYGFRSGKRLDAYHLYTSGFAVLYAAQVLLICCGVLQLLPLTGIPLPFISRSGTDLLCYFAAIGLMMGGYSRARREDASAQPPDTEPEADADIPWFLSTAENKRRNKEGEA